MKEVGCSLPDTRLAWWYVDKMRLDNATEVNLLSSVGNLYSLNKLQDAAIMNPTVSGRDDTMETDALRTGRRTRRKVSFFRFHWSRQGIMDCRVLFVID